MERILEKNGNLTFKIGDSRETLQDIKDRVGEDDVQFLAEMLDVCGFSGNGVLYPIAPEDVGGLTDAPMMSNGVEFPDEGGRIVYGDVWWFPNYQLENFANTLLEQGHVTFRAAA